MFEKYSHLYINNTVFRICFCFILCFFSFFSLFCLGVFAKDNETDTLNRSGSISIFNRDGDLIYSSSFDFEGLEDEHSVCAYVFDSVRSTIYLKNSEGNVVNFTNRITYIAGEYNPSVTTETFDSAGDHFSVWSATGTGFQSGQGYSIVISCPTFSNRDDAYRYLSTGDTTGMNPDSGWEDNTPKNKSQEDFSVPFITLNSINSISNCFIGKEGTLLDVSVSNYNEFDCKLEIEYESSVDTSYQLYYGNYSHDFDYSTAPLNFSKTVSGQIYYGDFLSNIVIEPFDAKTLSGKRFWNSDSFTRSIQTVLSSNGVDTTIENKFDLYPYSYLNFASGKEKFKFRFVNENDNTCSDWVVVEDGFFQTEPSVSTTDSDGKKTDNISGSGLKPSSSKSWNNMTFLEKIESMLDSIVSIFSKFVDLLSNLTNQDGFISQIGSVFTKVIPAWLWTLIGLGILVSVVITFVRR